MLLEKTTIIIHGSMRGIRCKLNVDSKYSKFIKAGQWGILGRKEQ